MSSGKRYVQITLVLEEAGILDSDYTSERYATRMYNLSDPNGILDGELELICTESQLENELRKLKATDISKPSTGVSTGYRSYTPQAEKITTRAAYKEAPDGVSASSLVKTLAKDTGSTSVFTQLVGDLLDDLLRPQSTKKRL